MSSFSKVVAAVVEDGSFGNLYFAENPMKRLRPIVESLGMSARAIAFADQNCSSILTVSKGHNVTVLTTVKNLQRTPQNYFYIMEVFDSNNIVTGIDIMRGSISGNQFLKFEDAILRVGNEQQTYTIKVFLIETDNGTEFVADVLIRSRW